MSKNRCGVIGCSNSYQKCPSGTKFYNIPSETRFPGRKKLWIDAIVRGNGSSAEYGSKWYLKKNARICSQHFIGGVKSDHPYQPNYIPTVFIKKNEDVEDNETIFGNDEFQRTSETEELDFDILDLPETNSVNAAYLRAIAANMGRPPKYANKEEANAAKREKERERRRKIKESEDAMAKLNDTIAKSIRLQKNAALQRRRREEESVEAKNKRRALVAEAQRQRRQNETEEEKLARLTRDAAAHRQRRQNESEVAKLTRLMQDAAAHRQRRQNETEEEKLARLAKNAAAQRQRRQNESEEEKLARLAQDAAAHRQRRQHESELGNLAQLTQDAMAHWQLCQNESYDASLVGLSQDAAVHRQLCGNESKEVSVIHHLTDAASYCHVLENETPEQREVENMPGRYCCVPGCQNNESKLNKWKIEPCKIHYGILQQDCPCEVPYKLHNFPTDTELKDMWIRAINNKTLVAPGSNAAVCSIHFGDGIPKMSLFNAATQDSITLISTKGIKREIEEVDDPGFSSKRSAITFSNNPIKIADYSKSTSFKEAQARSLMENLVQQSQFGSGVVNCIIKKETITNCAEIQTDTIYESRDHTYSGSFLNTQKQNTKLIQTDFPAFTANSLDESGIKFYTGLETHMFWNLVENLKPLANDFSFKLPVEDQVLMCFMRLKLNLFFEDLSRRFNMSCSSTSRMFNLWMPKMASYFSDLVCFLPREKIKEAMPASFRENFPNITCIVDCFEIILQHSSLVRDRQQPHQKQQYSKNKEKVKFLTAISPDGYIMFVSKCYEANNSNEFIGKNCGFLEYILPSDEVIAESNLNLESDLSEKQAILHYPEVVKEKMVLNEQTKGNVVTPGKSKHFRLQVEGAISRMKGFHFLKNASHIKSDRSNLNYILIVVAALCNLQHSVITLVDKNDDE